MLRLSANPAATNRSDVDWLDVQPDAKLLVRPESRLSLWSAPTMQITRWFFPMSVLLSAGSAWAHPGHGTTDPTSVAHAAEPIHLLPLICAAIAMSALSVLIYRQLRPAREQQHKR